jgi:hypothetical protein
MRGSIRVGAVLTLVLLAMVGTALIWMPWRSSSRPITFHDVLETSHLVGTYSFPHTLVADNLVDVVVYPTPRAISGSEILAIYELGEAKVGWVARKNGELIQYPDTPALHHMCMLTGITSSGYVARVRRYLPRSFDIQFKRVWPANERALWTIEGECSVIYPIFDH